MSIKDEVLYAFEHARGERLSGNALAMKLGVSRSAVNKAVCALRKEGLIINAVPGEGYQLDSDDDSLTVTGIQALIENEEIGRDIVVEKSLVSTNTAMKERYLYKDNGFTLIAEEQTGGRGRLGRTFSSPAETGVYMSILLRPELPTDKVHFITIAAAVAVSEAIAFTAGFEPQIKWVNDVLKDGRKLCGILTEATIEGESGVVNSVVVGIGINLRPNPNWPDEVKQVAGALSEFGTAPRRAVLISSVCSRLDAAYSLLKESRYDELLEQYRMRLCCIGKRVTVVGAAERYDAECVGLDSDGHLIVRDAESKTRTLSSGELSIKL